MNSQQAVEALAALGHEHRLNVYRQLVGAGPEGISAGTIAAHLRMPPSSLTFHLRNLESAGLVTKQRKSRRLIYAADFAVMNSLLEFMTANCCGGKAQDCLPALFQSKRSAPAAKKIARKALDKVD